MTHCDSYYSFYDVITQCNNSIQLELDVANISCCSLDSLEI